MITGRRLRDGCSDVIVSDSGGLDATKAIAVNVTLSFSVDVSAVGEIGTAGHGIFYHTHGQPTY